MPPPTAIRGGCSQALVLATLEGMNTLAIPSLRTAAPQVNRRQCLAAALALALPLAQAGRALAELPIPLAREAPPGLNPHGYLVSEKFDGVRAVWDGAQLRFRSGLPVAAPGWFVARLPHEPLDGELWLARGQFEALSGAVRRSQPDDAEWRQIRYQVFDLPRAEGGFAARYRRLVDLIETDIRPRCKWSGRSGWPMPQRCSAVCRKWCAPVARA